MLTKKYKVAMQRVSYEYADVVFEVPADCDPYSDEFDELLQEACWNVENWNPKHAEESKLSSPELLEEFDDDNALAAFDDKGGAK